MAHVFRVGIAETSTTIGTADFVLSGRVYGALAGFFDAMSVGDTCDYVARYGDTREEGIATRLVSGELERTSISYARHANGTIDQNKVSFAAGAKHIWMSVRGDRVAAFLDALRPQTFTEGQRNQACANIGMPQTGDKAIIPQASAWVGWTKDTTHHNKAIRLTTGVDGGSASGSVDFDTLHTRTATDNFTISQANLPSGTLAGSSASATVGVDTAQGTTNDAGSEFAQSGGGSNPLMPRGVFGNIAIAGVNLGGSGTALSASIDMRIKYVNAIITIKD